MMNKLDELEKLAKDVCSPGPWEFVCTDSYAGVGEVRFTLDGEAEALLAAHTDDAAFIAAANPDTVLKLIAVARAAGDFFYGQIIFHEGRHELQTEELSKALMALEEPDD